MRTLKDLSINAKLTLLVLVTGCVTLVLSSAAFVANNTCLIRASKVEQLSTLAKVLGSNSSAALVFDDPSAAREVLSALSLSPDVQFACIYNTEHEVFATYQSHRVADFKAPAPRDGDVEEFVQGGYLDVSRPIEQRGEKVGTLYLRASLDDVYTQLLRSLVIVGVVALISLGAALLLSSRLQRVVSMPILRLAKAARQISTQRDYSIRVERECNDELGALYDQFNAMLEQIQRGEAELQEAHDQLEVRVAERTHQLLNANNELSREIGERKRAESELEEVHRQLVDAARRAGMAEVATGVLHNVGNVLNSVNVSATLVADRLRNSRLPELHRALDLIEQNAGDLGRFITEHEKGKQLPAFMKLVAANLNRERTLVLEELRSLVKNIDHIKTIVAMQQSYAGAAGVVEAVSLADLMDDALKMNASSLEKYNIEVRRDYEDLPQVQVEKQKLLQILVNIVTNAKDALVESNPPQPRLVARIALDMHDGEGRVAIGVIDNGSGIRKENLTRIFSHGFTTKKHGHGFGLHASANAAGELGGSLVARSDGPGCGAVFTLQIPFTPIEVLV